MKTNINSLLSLALFVFLLNGCAPVANSWTNFVDNNPTAQKLNPYNYGKKDSAASHQEKKVVKETAPSVTKEVKKNIEGGGVFGGIANMWINFVDNNPVARKLNPMKNGQGLPQPVKDAMRMQGLNPEP